MTQREELKLCPFCGSVTEDGMGYNYHKVCCSNLTCHLSNVHFTKKEWNARAKAQAVPDGWMLVPIEPTTEQYGGLARDIIQWMRFTDSKDQHSESLVKWLKDMGNEIPAWLYSEPEINHLSKHVISKGTIAAIIYKAMLASAPEQVKGGE